MFRPIDIWRFTLVLAAALACACNARADDVADYLEQHNLKELLAVHLEQQLEKEKGSTETRAQLVDRLADLYAELLESVKDPARQAHFEERGRVLLQQVPANKADKLKLTLLRAKYLSAEAIAERHRLRLSTEEEKQAAIQTLTELIPQLAELRSDLKQDIETTDRRLTRSGGAETATLNEVAERTRGMYAQCTFLNAWSLYYVGWLTHRARDAEQAEPLFLEIIDPEARNSDPENVSVDLRAVDAVARSMLGIALCKSLTASSATAVSWIELLKNESTFAPIREQAPFWAIAVHLEHQEYEEAQAVVESLTTGNNKLNSGWLRLIAVHTLEDEHRSKAGSELAQQSVTELAVRGELEQVLDLANRYGTDALGEGGFALHYVKGVIKYQAAREAHGNETPTVDAMLASMYSEASSSFTAAMRSEDAKNFKPAVLECKKLLGWCMYLQSRFLEARDAFLEASNSLKENDAAEAHWMAIVAFDRVVEASPSPELQAKLGELIDGFLHQYPDSPHAPTLQLRRAITSGSASETTVSDLLSIPPESDVYPAAQRHVAELLYQQFRRRSNEARVKYGSEFLMVVMPLINAQTREGDMVDPTETRRFIGRCRQILEVALTEGIERLGAARSAFEALEYIEQNHHVDLSEFRDEIDCRRVQERLYAGDWEQAALLADQLWERDREMIWTRIAARALFKHAHELWKGPASTPDQIASGNQLVVKYGGRVLHEFKDNPKALEQPGALGYHTAVAEASLRKWEQTSDEEAGRAGLFLFEKLLSHRPRNSFYLRAVGILAMHFGSKEQALDCWRKLASGSKVDSPEWFEAKLNVIQLLSESNPSHAREVMSQHKVLYPDYGPEPWGDRLRALDAKLQKSGAQDASDITEPASQPQNQEPAPQ